MSEIGVNVEYHPLEKNGIYPLRGILLHLKESFKDLKERLTRDSSFTVRFPKYYLKDGKMAGGLVPQEVKDSWMMLDGKNYDHIIEALNKFIIIEIMRLQMEFGDRINFSPLEPSEACHNSFHVWPADMDNSQTPIGMKIPGEGYPQVLGVNKVGLYPVVVDPSFGYFKNEK
tara:strand:- start:142 stop:657 length:516 start_codon:yes stop_codon:yes gene_type:complete